MQNRNANGDLEDYSSIVFDNTPSGNKLISGLFNIAGLTNTQEDGVESHDFCTNEFAEVCMLPLCHLQLLPKPRIFTVLDFNQVHMSMVYIQLVGLSHAIGCHVGETHAVVLVRLQRAL
eukprot:709422-Pelagomonas_calceolata.AAC.1